MNRRFVSLVVGNYKSRMYSLHRLDASKHLFYPSLAEAEAAANEDTNNFVRNHGDDEPRKIIKKMRRLPDPILNLQPHLTRSTWSWGDMFALLNPRSGEEAGSRIFHADEQGRALLCDLESRSTMIMPSLNEPKRWFPIAFTIPSAAAAGPGEEETQQSLYVMRSVLGAATDMEVLHFAGGGSPPGGLKWQPLPRLPFVNEELYQKIVATTVAGDGGRAICLSVGTDDYVEGEGRSHDTYCLNTERGEWWHAGSWALPFGGRAVHVPELETWLGFSSDDPCDLCAVDLSGVATATGQALPPQPQHVWEDLDALFEERTSTVRGTERDITKRWLVEGLGIVNLGSGRFCIARVVKVEETVLIMFSYDYSQRILGEFAVLTGVEIVRQGGGLRMVKHKSRRYKFTNDEIKWVL